MLTALPSVWIPAAQQLRPTGRTSVKNVTAALLIVLVVVTTVWWITTHWSTYAPLLAMLWPLVVGFVVAIASFLEMSWWRRFDAWYYRTGPTVCREVWQTCGTLEQVTEAIRPVLDQEGWTGRETPARFFLRRRGFRGFGSRVCLRLEDTHHGTAVVYEVRPLRMAPLWLGALAALYFSRFRVVFVAPGTAWFTVPWSLLVLGWAVTYYAWLAPREARRMKRMRHIRLALARFRLGVCEACGYDLFGHVESSICPECGATIGPLSGRNGAPW